MILKSSIEVGAAVLTMAVAAPAQADRRAYGETYEAVTASEGELDVESWTSFASDAEVPNGPDGRGVRQMLELEYGLTDRWDVALYNILDVTTGDAGATKYAGLKVESRLRLALPGEWPVDTVLYLEYMRRLTGDADHSLEAKVIGAHDFGAWNVAGNLALEVEHLRTGSFNPEIEYAAGVSRELGSPSFKLGAEAFGKLELATTDTGAKALERFLWVGPAFSYAVGRVGPMRGLWITVAAGQGLAESKTFYGRAIVGLQF